MDDLEPDVELEFYSDTESSLAEQSGDEHQVSSAGRYVMASC